jgi:uncharacterized protein (TIRG00374 family)
MPADGEGAVTKPAALKLALKVTVTVVTLYLVFRLIPASEVLPVLGRADPVLFGLGTALLFVMRWLAALRTRAVLGAHSIHIPAGDLMSISLSAAFYAMILPGNLVGGAVRWYRMNQAARRPAEILAAIGVDRLVDTLSVVVLGVGFWLVQGRTDTRDVGWALFGVAAALIVSYILAMNGRLAFRAKTFLERTRLIPKLWRPAAVKVVDAVHQYRDLSVRDHVGILGLSGFKDVLGIVGLVLYAQSLALPVGFILLGWLRSFIVLIGLLPIALGGLGVREGSLALLLRPYGVDAASAVAFSLLVFLGNLSLSAVGGLLELRLLYSSRRAGHVPLEAATPSGTSGSRDE